MPITRRSLNFDFVRDGSLGGQNFLDPLWTFTRAGAGATRINASGLIEPVAANVPRFDFDPVTLQCRGLLIEGARTNLLPNSALDYSDLTSTGWVKGESAGGTVALATEADAFGTVMKLTCAADAGQIAGLVQQGSSGVTVSQAYAHSLWVKAFGVGDVGKQILVRGVGAANYGVFTLTAQWQRITRTEVATVAYPYIEFGLRPDLGSSSGTVTFLASRAQLELGATASSYIPTTSAAVTRAADVYYTAALAPWWRLSAGTFVIEWERGQPDGYSTLAGLDNGSNRYVAYQNPANDNVYSLWPGMSAAQEITASASPGQHRLALAYAASPAAFKAAVDNAPVQSFPAGAAEVDLAAVTRLTLGANPGGGEHLNGHLRRFTYLPFAVDDLTLRAMSAG